LKLELLDFGASRGFPQEFIDDYLAVLKAAANLDREQCRIISLRLGYLTGRETEVLPQLPSLILVNVECPYRFNSHLGRAILHSCPRGIRLFKSGCHCTSQSTHSYDVETSIDAAAQGDLFSTQKVEWCFSVVCKSGCKSKVSGVI
jgi:hypothetical protein